MLDGNQSQSGRFTKDRNLVSLPGFEPRLVELAANPAAVVITFSNSDLFVEGVAAI